MQNNNLSLSGYLSPKKLIKKQKRGLSKDNSESSLKLNKMGSSNVNKLTQDQSSPQLKKNQHNIQQTKVRYNRNINKFDREPENEQEQVGHKYNPAATNKQKYQKHTQQEQSQRGNKEKQKQKLDLKHQHSERDPEEDYIPQSVKIRMSNKQKSIQNYNSSKIVDALNSRNTGGNSSGRQNFQSSRLQTKQCLQELSRKVANQISNLHSTIDEFNRRIRKTIEVEYEKLKDFIRSMVEEIFDHSQQNIKKLYKSEEKKINQQLYDLNEQLESMYEKLEKMKEGIQGPNWKKIAGEVLASDIEHEVNSLVQVCQKVNVFKNIKLQADSRKLEIFEKNLEGLLDLSLSSTGESTRIAIMT